MILLFGFLYKFVFYKDDFIVQSHFIEESIQENFEEDTSFKAQSVDLDEPKNLEINKIVAYISGEVLNPDVYVMDENSRIKDIINAAGGTTKDAFTKYINLAKIIEDQEHIYIPSISENQNQNIDQDLGFEEDKGSKIININTADASQLATLPGIGQVTAQNIIDYRKTNGNFQKKEDIKNVTRIGEKIYERISNYIKVK